MNKIIVRVQNREYPIICGEGQEQRVRELAAMIDDRAGQIAAASPNTTEAMILLLSALMLADEVQDMRQQFESMHGFEETTALKLELLADRIQQIASLLAIPAGISQNTV